MELGPVIEAQQRTEVSPSPSDTLKTQDPMPQAEEQQRAKDVRRKDKIFENLVRMDLGLQESCEKVQSYLQQRGNSVECDPLIVLGIQAEVKKLYEALVNLRNFDTESDLEAENLKVEMLARISKQMRVAYDVCKTSSAVIYSNSQ